jgi:signal transduction histidine kinase
LKRISNWIAQSLTRKLTLGLALIMVSASAFFLLLIVVLFYRQLWTERADASAEVNLLLQASLENAMLKRDLPGLAGIVTRLGQQENVRRVMIVNPRREVRFASEPAMLNRQLESRDLTGCSDCAADAPLPGGLVRFTTAAPEQILRTVNPIANKPPCATCHGELQQHPVNGLLIVDYKSDGLLRPVLVSAAIMAAAGASIIALALVAVWLFLRRAVINRVTSLGVASGLIASGNFAARVACDATDELSLLCQTFNRMADQLEETIEELAARRRFMQELVDAMPDAIRLIDEDYRIVLVNAAYGAQLQRSGESFVGTPCYASSHGRSEPCVPTLIACPVFEMKKGRLPLKALYRHVRRDERELPVEVSAAALTTLQNGERRRFVVEVIRDLEQQARISQSQRLSELGKLAAGVAHEIHNPLASVKLGLQSLMKMKTRSELGDELYGYLQQVDGEVDKCIDTTKRLLKLSLAPPDNLQLVAFEDIVPEVISLLRYEAELNHITIDLRLARGMRVFATDAEIRMLTLNLSQNAFHAMPKGGTLTITGWIDGDDAVVGFQDTGVGISADILDQIFDPFFSRRADRNELATGLGLTICKSITDRYRGSISAASRAGEGALFTVRFPLADRMNHDARPEA